MSITIHEAHTRPELDAIVDIKWTATEHKDPFWPLLYPVFPSSADERARAIAESKERHWKDHISNPASHWIYACEGEKVVGCCQWRIYDENPWHQGPPLVEATWWPVEPERSFTTHVVNQLMVRRGTWMARPHSGPSGMAVLPSHERRGIGTMLMQWGIEKTDARGLESFLEASTYGKRLYERLGYHEVKDVEIGLEGVDGMARADWKDLEKRYLPIKYTAMWRAKDGNDDDKIRHSTWSKRLMTAKEGTVCCSNTSSFE